MSTLQVPTQVSWTDISEDDVRSLAAIFKQWHSLADGLLSNDLACPVARVFELFDRIDHLKRLVDEFLLAIPPSAQPTLDKGGQNDC